MSLPEPSDADDVRRTLAGDREAFGRLFDRHARFVRTVVAAHSGDFSTVEDQTQETFLRAYRRLASLKNVEGFRSWIQGIARLVAKERRRQFVYDRLRFEASKIQLVTDDDARDAAQCDEERRRLLSAVAELPERERLVIHAYFFHDQSADRAARAIGLSRSGFYAVLDRGLSRLRKRLGEPSPPPATGRKER